MTNLQELYDQREAMDNLRFLLSEAIVESRAVTAAGSFDFGDMTAMLEEEHERVVADLEYIDSDIMRAESEEQAAATRAYWKAVV